jgi:non-ribosomal peptide synthetase component F/acyl carrier protein
MNENLNVSLAERAAAQERIAEKAYWLQQLAYCNGCVALPYDQEDGSAAAFTAHERLMAEGVGKKLSQISNHSDQRLFVILLAGVVALIHKYTDRDDVVVRVPVFRQPAGKNLINSQFLFRHRCNPGTSFKEGLLAVKKKFEEALTHQNYPFKALLNDLGPGAGAARLLTDIGVLLENVHDPDYLGPVKPNLLFRFSQTGAALRLRIEYNAGKYHPSSIEFLAAHLETFLTNALSDPDRPVSAISMVPEAELRLITAAGSGARVAFPVDPRLGEAAPGQREQTAVMAGNRAVTYGQLHALADGLSRALRERGVGAGQLAGIRVSNPADALVAMFAVLKTGGTFVRIPVHCPQEQAERMIRDNACRCLISDEKPQWLQAYGPLIGVTDVAGLPAQPIGAAGAGELGTAGVQDTPAPSNGQLLVLDKQGALLPVGVWGEICIGGPGPDSLTPPACVRERLVAHPLAPHQPLYRTGEVGRWRGDGNLECRGRDERRAEPPRPQGPAQQPGVAPQTGQVRAQLFEILGKLGRIDQEDEDASFQELGIHSLKMMSLFRQIREKLKLNLQLSELFEHNTVRKLTAFLAARVPVKPAVLPRAEQKEYYPLSPAQQRLLFIQLAWGNSTAYNLPMVYRLRGPLAVARLEYTLNELIGRHESLRTSFFTMQGHSYQKIHPKASMRATVEVHHAGDEASEASIIAGFVRPFNLAKAPLFRVGLIRKSEQDHVLMLDAHHIISDGHSSDLLLQEMLAIYHGNLPARPVYQYRDFSEAQRRQTHAYAAAAAYWHEQLSGVLPQVTLPTDFKRPALFRTDGATTRFTLPPATEENIFALSRTHAASVYTVVLSLFNVFLMKMTNQRDILVGSPVSGRTQPEYGQIVGLFTNTVVLRNQVEPGYPYRDFLDAVNRNTAAALRHQDFPFGDLVKRFAGRNDLSRNPLFNIAYVYEQAQPLPAAAGHAGPLRVEGYAYDPDIAKFDLTLFCLQEGEGLTFSVIHNTNLYRASTVARYIDCFIRVAETLTQAPSLPVGEVRLDHLSRKASPKVDITFNY